MTESRKCLCKRCQLGLDLPNTLQKLASVTTVEPLADSMETMAMVATQFEDAMITTCNAGALISGRGGYAPLQTDRSPWCVSYLRTTLRVFPQSALQLSRSSVAPDLYLPGSIVATDRSGKIRHRIQYVSEYDTRVASVLAATADAAPPPKQAEASADIDSKVVSLTAIRAAREQWDTADTCAHLNDIISDGGVWRRQCLPHIGAQRARLVAKDFLPSFLGYLRKKGFGFTRIIPCRGLLQAYAGPAEEVVHQQHLLVVAAPRSFFSLDLSQVESCWVTNWGREWQLEIYDRERRAAAIFGKEPVVDHDKWRALLSVLPSARS